MSDVNKMYTYLRGFITGAKLSNSMRALSFMRKKHDGQTRKDGTPYIVHPLAMACYALAIGVTDDITIATILLHDVVEDCNTSLKELPVDDEVKAAVKHMTITSFDTDVDKIETKCRYFNELLDCPSAVICKALDRYNNLSDAVSSFSSDALAKNLVETDFLLLPVLYDAKQNYPELADVLFVLRTNLETLIYALKPNVLVEYEKWQSVYNRVNKNI